MRVRPGLSGPTVEVGGEIDLESGPRLHDQLCSVMQAYGPRLTVDLTGVTFIDCAGLSALLASRRAAQGLGGGMRLAQMSCCVRRLIEVTGLQRLPGFCLPAVPLVHTPGRNSAGDANLPGPAAAVGQQPHGASQASGSAVNWLTSGPPEGHARYAVAVKWTMGLPDSALARLCVASRSRKTGPKPSTGPGPQRRERR
jgi:anti-anti-sigma factor